MQYCLAIPFFDKHDLFCMGQCKAFAQIGPCQTSNMELFTKEVTFLTKPLRAGQIYVRGIFVEHSLEIFLVYSEKILNETLENIPK